METIILDVFERPEMETYLSQTLVVQRQNLVSVGVGDIMWWCGHLVSLEHKTIDQAMLEMGGRLDEQLRKHSRNADEVGLIIDGIATPIPGERACQLWTIRKDNKLIYPRKRKIHIPWETFQAYLWRLDKEGFTVYQAPDLSSMCLAISAFVYNSIKPEHQSLRRYIKTKPVIWEEENKPIYHYIRTLMGISGARIGEATARKLLEAYGTPHKVFMGNPLDGKWPVGKTVFQQMQKAIGRNY